MPSSRQTRSKTATKTNPKRKLMSKNEISAALLADELSSATPASKKRKSTATPSAQKGKQAVNQAHGLDLEDASPSKKKRKPSPQKDEDDEKRLRLFRKKAPLSYLEKLDRATSQRMFVFDRTRSGTEGAPEETIEMAGTTGNVYHVRICHLPSCTCPDSKKGKQCKNIVYVSPTNNHTFSETNMALTAGLRKVLHKVLKAPEHLQYQLAFLSSELRTIFTSSPPPPSTLPAPASNRKPLDPTSDCPICFSPLTSSSAESITFCKAQCGNNIHSTCFAQWARSQPADAEVRCVYCRTPWQYDNEMDEEGLRRIKEAGKVGEEGYVNVGEELGLSGVRDYSTYHPYWVRRELGPYY